MKFCEICGGRLEDLDTICLYCGNKVTVEERVSAIPVKEQEERVSTIPVKEQEERVFTIPVKEQEERVSTIPKKEGFVSENLQNQPQAELKKIGKRSGMQRFLSEVPKTVSFIISAVLNTIIQLLIFLMIIITLIEGDVLFSIEAMLVWIPILVFTIGQWVFLANGMSKTEEMSMAGVIILKVSVIMTQINLAINFIILCYSTISGIRNAETTVFWALYSDSRSEYIRSVKTRLIFRFIILLIILILDFVGYIKGLSLLNALKSMKKTEKFPKGKISIYLVAVLCIKAVVMFILSIICFIKGVFFIFVGCICIIIALSYIFLAVAIEGIQFKIDKKRGMAELFANEDELSEDVWLKTLSYRDAKSYTDNKLLNNNGWRCLCGVVNPSYTGTCGCGRTKEEVTKPKVSLVNEDRNKIEKITPVDSIAETEKTKRIENTVENVVTKPSDNDKKIAVKETVESVESEEELQERLKTDNMRMQSLIKLKEMFDAGILTQGEYEKNKKTIYDAITPKTRAD